MELKNKTVVITGGTKGLGLMKKKIFILIIVIILLGLCFVYFYHSNKKVIINNPKENDISVIYKNIDYGFDFVLPISWRGYSIIENTWQGNALKNQIEQSGPKIIIRNPKWTTSMPYEDLPILVFTISQWNSYLAEDFSVSAAPIMASELGRNNEYVFALPPRWDFDYSFNYKEAEDIIAGKPIKPFNIQVSD